MRMRTAVISHANDTDWRPDLLTNDVQPAEYSLAISHSPTICVVVGRLSSGVDRSSGR